MNVLLLTTLFPTSSTIKKTAPSIFSSTLSYTGLLTISAKFKAPGAFRCREWVAEL